MEPDSPVPNEEELAESLSTPKPRDRRNIDRAMTQYKRAIRSAVTDADMKEVMATIVRAAKEGDMKAAKLLLEYTAGKPETPSHGGSGGGGNQVFVFSHTAPSSFRMDQKAPRELVDSQDG